VKEFFYCKQNRSATSAADLKEIVRSFVLFGIFAAVSIFIGQIDVVS
jgi:hypothetical protein